VFDEVGDAAERRGLVGTADAEHDRPHTRPLDVGPEHGYAIDDGLVHLVGFDHRSPQNIDGPWGGKATITKSGR
jgi:hypothetical protein